jgi:hypothetical protein
MLFYKYHIDGAPDKLADCVVPTSQSARTEGECVKFSHAIGCISEWRKSHKPRDCCDVMLLNIPILKAQAVKYTACNFDTFKVALKYKED